MLAGEVHRRPGHKLAEGDLYAYKVTQASGKVGQPTLWREVFSKLSGSGAHVLLYHAPSNTWLYGGEWVSTERIPQTERDRAYTFHVYRPPRAGYQGLAERFLFEAASSGLLRRLAGIRPGKLAVDVNEATRVFALYRERRRDLVDKAPGGTESATVEESHRPVRIARSRFESLFLSPQVEADPQAAFLAHQFLRQLRWHYADLRVDGGNLRVSRLTDLTPAEIQLMRKVFGGLVIAYHADRQPGVARGTPAYDLCVRILEQASAVLKELRSEERLRKERIQC